MKPPTFFQKIRSVSLLFAATAMAHAVQYGPQNFAVADGTTDLGDGTTIASSDGSASVQIGALQLTADGTFSDSGTQDLTDQVIWTSSATNVAQVIGGTVTARTVGTATITAEDGPTGIRDQVGVTVTPAVLQTLAVAPSNVTLPDGRTSPLRL